MRNYLKFLRIHSRAFGIALIFSLFIGSLSFFIYISLKKWKDQVVETNMVLCDVLAEQLTFSAEETIAALKKENLFNITNLTANQSKEIDQRLKRISTTLLSRTKGIEGGFFLYSYDQFFGYAYPTSPPPKPVYGPPPRSYNIIKEQVLETIHSKTSITRLHQFDPAVFPLSTRPLKVNGEVVGAVWARIHIERELPYLKLREVINIGFILAFFGFLIAGFSSLKVRKKIQQLSADLEAIQQGKSTSVRPLTGNLDYVVRSVNRMLKALNSEHEEREKLERELNQKAKMASLGRLVAGVAHEVKTPLAIVKTRIQMWQKDLKDYPVAKLPASLSDESMQMIVNETNRLDGLVKRLLFFSRPISPTLQSVRINDILLHTIRFIQTSTKQKRLNIITELDTTLPSITADPNSLEQVFINLIMNALEAGSEESTVTVRSEYSNNKTNIRVQIIDSGEGIPKEHYSKIFDPFFTTKDKGFGLGLSISYEIITAHQGRIYFKKNIPRGTICSVEIPLKNTFYKKENHVL